MVVQVVVDWARGDGALPAPLPMSIGRSTKLQRNQETLSCRCNAPLEVRHSVLPCSVRAA